MILIFVHVAFVFECFVGAFARTMLRSYSPSTEPTTCHITVTVTSSIIVARVAKKYAAEGVSWQYGCFLKWWTLKWSFLVGKPMVVGETLHFRKPPYSGYLIWVLYRYPLFTEADPTGRSSLTRERWAFRCPRPWANTPRPVGNWDPAACCMMWLGWSCGRGGIFFGGHGM